MPNSREFSLLAPLRVQDPSQAPRDPNVRHPRTAAVCNRLPPLLYRPGPSYRAASECPRTPARADTVPGSTAPYSSAPPGDGRPCSHRAARGPGTCLPALPMKAAQSIKGRHEGRTCYRPHMRRRLQLLHFALLRDLCGHPRVQHLLLRLHDLELQHHGCDRIAQRGGQQDLRTRPANRSGHPDSSRNPSLRGPARTTPMSRVRERSMLSRTVITYRTARRTADRR